MHIAKAFEGIIRINKKIAELNYKISYKERIGQDSKELRNELEELKEDREKLENTLKQFNIAFFIPFEYEINEFNEKLKQFTLEQINLAMRKKQGSAWEILKARALLIKNNLFHAYLIGRLAEILLMTNEDTRKKVIEAVKKGKIEEDIEINEESVGLRIAKFLSRLGIDARYENGFLISKPFPFKEIGIKIGEKIIYVPEDRLNEIADNEQRLKEVSIRIQMKNAEKQIKTFSKEEDKEFERIQEEYLNLLKKREDYLNKYKD